MSRTLNKQDVARRAAKIAGLSIAKAEVWTPAVVEALAQLIMEAEPGDRIEMRGFGVLEMRQKQSREMTNPATKEVVVIPARRSIHFKTSKRIRRALVTRTPG